MSAALQDDAAATKGDILVVDDNPVNLDLLSNMLQDRSYRVRVATNGRRALAAAKSRPPDLVMLDINMPEMDGYEVCRQLKADPVTADVPVIFISALDEAMDKVRAFEVGGADYVTKPFQFEEVLARIENQLKLSRLQRVLERKNAELTAKNEELVRSRDELLKSQQQAANFFSALADVLPGTVLDEKYKLEEKIGAGGFGTVYRAVHLGLDRLVAVKIFKPASGTVTQEGLDRFRLEGVRACQIQHRNAVAVSDFGVSTAGIAYLVMELLEGRTLTDELQDAGRLSPERCVEILTPICGVLAEAHAAGIVHRDIKPDNIFLHRSKDGEIVKVLDFGLAKLLDDSPAPSAQNLTVGTVLGTPTYMSPERLNDSPYDGQSDVYSTGILLYQMLTGNVPFQSREGDYWAVAIMHLTKTPPSLRESNPGLTPEIEEVVLRSLAKDPSARPSAESLATDFSAAVAAAAPPDAARSV
ncbi:MAG: response regulator [Blastocatellia bacterium]|nr:response regulator [Blastocatellia bacterium]